MKISCLQMKVAFCDVEENFRHAAQLIENAMMEGPDVLVLPETWNTGFFPKENLRDLCDNDGSRVKREIGALAKKRHVNIIAGSVSSLRSGKVYNTALVFDREGTCIASYDKTHLFTPMGEDDYYTPGDHLCRFTLDGIRCGLIICYDVRFPELTRSLTVPGLDMLFMVSQWPKVRSFHLRSLTTARAIENQMFLVCCNACGNADETVYGGNSAIVDPWGQTVALAGEHEQILTAHCDMSILHDIRSTIPVFRDRRAELYKI
jgi:predicted amidohydrolase